MAYRRGRASDTLSFKDLSSYFKTGELQIIGEMEKMFRIHEATDYAGIIGSTIQFYRYNPAIEGGKGSISIHWSGYGWKISGVGVKKHKRKVLKNNGP